MTNISNNKLVLMNDDVFSRVYTAGTNVKKFTQQLGKQKQNLNVVKVSEYVLRLVESRNLPLEVNAKIVCGMGRILLHHLQNILAEVLAIQKRSSLDQRIGYGEKNVVRKLKVQLECKTGGGKNLAAPLDLDLEYFDMDMDIQEQITEKEVIYSLSCNNNTTVKNVEDITMRDDMRSECYGTQLQLTDDNDFGETLPSEMMDFLHSNDNDFGETLPSEMMEFLHSNDKLVEDSVAQIQPEPATLDDMMDFDQSVDADLDMPNNSSYRPLHEADNNAHNPPAEPVVEKQNTLIEECKVGQKRRLIIDTVKQISSNCFSRTMFNQSSTCPKRQAPSFQELLAVHRLNSLFTKPMRDCCNSSKFDRNIQSSRKRSKCFSNKSMEQTGPKQQNVADLPPEQSCDDPHFVSLGPMKPSEMENFLTSFNGNQSQWELLKSCEPSPSEGVKQKKNEGVVSQYAVKTLLDAMFAESTEDSIPFKSLQAKMGNRLIAVSLFAKLLELSKEKIIRVSTNEQGAPFSVHKYINWM
ncbi:uncharacterized protein LOC128712448 [Anopheles marshallii]|uniref:uncharacterized protein LOC128712448 n=1 Tax=Anopheles marshallii TaxID=1521116 RepID=UPI00237B6D2E|nr:uncharacterized protein LOC128712448 [Anopheles marshallii]